MSRKILFAVFLALWGASLCPMESLAVMQPTILEVSGLLVKIDESGESLELTLDVNGTPVSGPLEGGCEFKDERERLITMKDFVKRYAGKWITVELYEHNGVIILGYSGMPKR